MSVKSFFQNIWKYRVLLLFVLPGMILIIMFNYIPFFGLTVAFRNYNFSKGIWDSEWVGLDNIRFLFLSKENSWRMLRNTVGYYFLFTAVGTVANIALAIALNECRNKHFAKVTQTIMIMPTFISFIAVAFIVKGLLSDNGIVNNILVTFGLNRIAFYTQPMYWPFVLTTVNLWKGVGYGSVLYLSALAGMDQEIFDAAGLDGATRWQKIRYITIPMLSSMAAILTLMGLGRIMTSNTGLFYQVTRNIGALYPATLTLDSYVLNAMMDGSASFGVTTAVTLFQSVVGCVLVVAVNLIIRRISPEHALF